MFGVAAVVFIPTFARGGASEAEALHARMPAFSPSTLVLLLAAGTASKNCTLKPSTDPTTRANCVQTARGFLSSCECTACALPYQLIGSRLCPLCPIMPPYKCYKIPHCASMEFCSDCGCSEHWCCDHCDANFTAVGSGSLPDQCVCKPPRIERNGTCTER